MAEQGNKSLDEMNASELRDRAAELEITGRSSMNKDELLQSVKDAEEQLGQLEGGGSQADTASAEDTSSNEWDAFANQESDSGDSQRSGGSDESDGGEKDASDITAPSIGPNTTIEHVPPEERLDLEKISDVDAMGLDKRRQVAGRRYGASPAKQAAVYGGAVAVIIGLAFGAKLLADELDQPPAVQEDTAPWSDAQQRPPAPIDFPRSTEQ